MNAQAAAQKYDRNTQGKGGYWKSRTTQEAGHYCEAMGEFLNIGAGACASSGPGRDYAAGIQAATPGSYDQGVANKGTKWLNNMRAKFGAPATG